MSALKVEAEIYNFGGRLLKLSHESLVNNCSMGVNLYLPKQYYEGKTKIPVLFYLAGLTCTPANGSEKAFFQPYADKYGFAVVFPDTSPRGVKIEGDDETWSFGTGAGFYVDAVQEKWKKNYNMYSYILKELPTLLKTKYTQLDFDNKSITGHSMGGYGAIMFFLRNPNEFKSCSAFAPILNPSKTNWGIKCFGGYLGESESDKKLWEKYDPAEIISSNSYKGPVVPILIHQGVNDPFYKVKGDYDYLTPNEFLEKIKGSNYEKDVTLKFVDGFDHSYFFISSFSGEHAAHHAKYLGLLD
ncbi:S-formylglutathione hydrolase [Ascoidea rubescens DSM 1968]|uniref:S-formylglutathione hydrolase n=1 Tax=Ascoidea rubescens DSM 1968 TaxID=1344418 RepID=A0A1D2VMG3_9ASCO|nr:carbohydrate esterase family 1 protein [Ascoidea rubescens DSM 1968]ODV62808.1 carbohydrate esterase family 1 protein [Ascoidea rubescens DSM 1968]